MIETRKQAKQREREDLSYIISNVLIQGEDSDILKALIYQRCASVLDVACSSDAEFEALNYRITDANNKMEIIYLKDLYENN